jgi:hypothetical protein
MIKTIEIAIEERLKTHSGVAAVVDKVYANIADQESEQSDDPYIVIIKDSKEGEQTQDGVGIIMVSIFTDIYHNNISTAIEIIDTVQQALQDYEGEHGQVGVQEMWQVDETMARDDDVSKHVYRLEWAIRMYKVTQ